MKKKAIYIELEKLSVAAIAGQTRSGKSSTAKFIIAQLLLDTSRLLICDPHGNVAGDSLASAIEPLEKYLDKPIARTKDEILAHFRYIAKLFKARINGARIDEQYVLFLDETPQFIMSCEREEVKEIIQILVAIANQAAKVNIRVFLLGQSWKKDYVGAAEIRAAINTIIFHRLAEDETKKFIPSAPASMRRKIANLKQGHALLYGIGLDTIEVTVPYVSKDDLIDLAKQLDKKGSHTRSQRDEESHIDTRDHTDYNQESHRSHTNILSELLAKYTSGDRVIKIEKSKNITHAIQMITYAINNDMPKGKTLEIIFDTTRGGKNKKWLAASKLWDSIYDKLE